MIFFDVSDNKIKAIIEKRGVVLSPGQAKEVEDLWSLKIKDNPKMFRGVSFGLKDIKIVNDGLILTIKKLTIL